MICQQMSARSRPRRDVVRKMPLLAAIALACLLPRIGSTAASPKEKSPEPTSAVHTENYVRIGGIDQWITINGTDRRNPVVLILHGGPGDAWSLVADSLFSGWDRSLTLVQWDQRGAGKTYAKNGESIESTMTIERMVEDGIEVAEYLREHLHQRKVILCGSSWGSVLGILMARKRPDLFYAYVADGQEVSWQGSLARSYAELRELAQSKKDERTLEALNGLGPPPWNSIQKWVVYRKALNAYEAMLTTAPKVPRPAVAPEYEADLKKGVYSRSDDFSFHHFVGPTLSGPFTRLDLTSVTDFEIPIFMIHGQFDLVNPTELARAYFDTIRAPRKEFYLVPGSGHDFSLTSFNLLEKVLLTDARPIAYPRR